MGWGLAGIWWALSIELVVRGLLFLWRFLQPGWERLRV
jgi:Na+-driven multidrug efflux pump